MNLVLLRTFIAIYWHQWQQYSWQPLWLHQRHPDDGHFHRRRFTTKYRNKQKIVRNLWFVVGLLMLSFPALSFVVGLGLLTTFVSFTILDETE